MADPAAKRARAGGAAGGECNEALVLNLPQGKQWGDGPLDMGIQPWPMPKPAEGEVLLEVRRVGICGSDVHYWRRGRIGDDFVCRAPMVLGHESAGVVAGVGEGVANLRTGDRVAIEAGNPCDACRTCREGKYNLCPGMRFFATPYPAGNPGHGSLARYIAHPAKWCFKLPDHVTLEEGAFCEPLSVGVYACEQKCRVRPGDAVCIFGAGPIGTVCALVARGMGAGRIVVVGLTQQRLDLLKAQVPTAVTISAIGISPQEVADKVVTANGGEPVDGAMDCCGAEPALVAAIKCTKRGGVVALMGLGKAEQTVPVMDALLREVNLEGVFRYRNTYPKCIELLGSKKIDIAPLLTHRFEFTQESLNAAFETCHSGKGTDGKTSIKCMISIEPKGA